LIDQRSDGVQKLIKYRYYNIAPEDNNKGLLLSNL